MSEKFANKKERRAPLAKIRISIQPYTLSALAKEQLIPSKYAETAMKKYNIDKNKPTPSVL